MAKNPKQDFENQVNQGEGNKTAARDYNRNATEHARSGKSDPAARDAEKAVEGGDAGLEEAEHEGKSHIAEEDPEVRGPA
jgi:hypothetical protein